jgi:Mn-containing catalase
MYYTDKKLQFPVTVEKPNPVFARMLQQAIGGVEGEIRVCMQYFFQAWGARGPAKYRDMLLNTATEEISHIEMLATAVALNLEKAPVSFQEEMAADPIAGAVMNGMDMRHILSAGLAAMPSDANGVPFNMSHIYASGNLAGDMYCNVAAEATGRVLAVRLYNATDDPGMKKMLAFNIARDTMHQQQWLAVLEELGPSHLPVPNSFPQSQENKITVTSFSSRRRTSRLAIRKDSRGRRVLPRTGVDSSSRLLQDHSKVLVNPILDSAAPIRSDRTSKLLEPLPGCSRRVRTLSHASLTRI